MANSLKVEHMVLRALSDLRSGGGRERWLVAVSGGADSIALAEMLFRWRRHFKVELTVAHVHHGYGPSRRQNQYRDLAQKCVADWCETRGVRFFTNDPGLAVADSEAELREWRRSHLRGWLARGFDRVVFGHQLEDLIETRLMRLIRGTGPQGLKAMAPVSGRVLRPLLRLSRAEIREYARERGLKWVEDPSNQEENSFRNWMRLKWLPDLERRSPGASKSLARSLQTLASDGFTETIGPFVGLRREALGRQPLSRREGIVARYLRSLGAKGYSQTHVRELLKRMDAKGGGEAFSMLGFSFQATPDFLWASRV